MMERLGDHLTYLAKYATDSTAFQHSEEVQKVRCNCIVMFFQVS